MVSDISYQVFHFAAHSITAVGTALLGYWVLARTDLSARDWIWLWLANFAVWSTVSAVLVVVTHQPTAFVLFWLGTFVGVTAIYLTYLFPTAYSGRNPLTSRVCRLASGIYALLALIVITGPFHDIYWQSVSFVESPFPHFAVEYGIGWAATIVYSVGAVGVLLYYFAELYFRSRRQHRRLVVVLAVGAVAGFVPVVLSVVDVLVGTYEYYAFTGAVQALAVGYVALRFGSVNLSTVARDETLDYLVDPYLALDTEYRIVDFNKASSQLIDGLDTTQVGEPLGDVFPELADRLTLGGRVDDPDEPLTVEIDGLPRYFSIDLSRIADWKSTRCFAVVLNDVTELEATRRELESQNQKLDAFAGTVSHDLRSPLSVISGRLKLAQMDTESEHLDHIADAHRRMDELIGDLLLLAREGQDVGETMPVELAAVAQQAWRSIDSSEGSLAVDTDRQLLADRSRLQQLFENLLRNSLEHGATQNQPADSDDDESESETAVDEDNSSNVDKAEPSSVDEDNSSNVDKAEPSSVDKDNSSSVGKAEPSYVDDGAVATATGIEITVGALDDGFYIEDNGPGILEGDHQTIFEAGYTTNDDGTGFGLAIAAEIVAAHGWEIRATDSVDGGARFEITGVDRVE